MTYQVTEEDCAFIRKLSFGYSRRRNFSRMWREDAAQFSVLEALKLAKRHDETISPFRAAMVTRVFRWTMRFFMWERNHAWRQDAYKQGVVHYLDPDDFNEPTHHEDPLDQLIKKESLGQFEAWMDSCTRAQKRILNLLYSGKSQTEAAKELGVTTQAINDTLRRIERRLGYASN